MAIDLKEYNRLKSAAESLKTKADQSAGAYKQLMARLKKEYGCKTIAEAETAYKERKRKAAQAEAAFAKGLKAFRKKYDEVLAVLENE